MKYAVWGCGPATSQIVRAASYSDAAYRTLLAADPRSRPEWCAEVECDDEATLDEATRYDRNIIGYMPIDPEV